MTHSLKIDQRPEVWFFKTLHETNKSGVPRACLLPGQYIPTKVEGEYTLADEDLFVNADDEARKINPEGTVFAVEKIVAKQNTKGAITNYLTFKAPVYVVDGKCGKH